MRVISIIVVTLNEAPHLPRLQKALSSLALPPDCRLETILVDGGSADGSAGLARALGFTKVLELPGASIPACRNRGLEAATGAWIAFLDGDCEPAADWLAQAAPVLSAHSACLIGWPVAPPLPGTWVQRYWNLHWMNKRPGSGTDTFRLLTTRNMLMTRTVAEQLDGFDEQLATGEDTDFALRAAQAGIPVLALPELRVLHHGEPATLRQFFRQQLWHANRKSYGKIARATKFRAGGNAIFFSLLYVDGLISLAIALLLAWVFHSWWWLLLGLPLPSLIAMPAAIISWRARAPGAFLPLCLLYATYGWARSLDLLGLHTEKTSWKKATPIGPPPPPGK